MKGREAFDCLADDDVVGFKAANALDNPETAEDVVGRGVSGLTRYADLVEGNCSGGGRRRLKRGSSGSGDRDRSRTKPNGCPKPEFRMEVTNS